MNNFLLNILLLSLNYGSNLGRTSNRMGSNFGISREIESSRSSSLRDDSNLAAIERRARRRTQTRYTLFTVESPAGHADINFEATIKFVKTCLDLVSAFDHYPEVKFHVDRKHKINAVDELPYRYSFFSIDLSHNKSQHNYERVNEFIRSSSDFVHADKIEIFVKTATGRKIGVVADTSDTIHNLKRKIAEKEGIPADQQILEFEGRPLDNDRKIFDYNIRRESQLDMKHSIDIRVKLGDSFEFTVAMLPTETVSALKAKLAELNRLGLDKIKLNFQGTEMLNPKRLIDYNVTSGALIEATIAAA